MNLSLCQSFRQDNDLCSTTEVVPVVIADSVSSEALPETKKTTEDPVDDLQIKQTQRTQMILIPKNPKAL